MLGTINAHSAPHVVVFEDAPKGISAVSNLGFYSVGISRKSTSGLELASKKDLREAGATIVLNEKELASLSYKDLFAQINTAISLD